MKFYLPIFTSFLGILLFVSQISAAQESSSDKGVSGFMSDTKPVNAATQINQLKEGVLIVKLTSDRKKIEALEQELQRDRGNKKVEKRLEHTRNARAEYIAAWMEGMKEEYDFSRVLFMFDFDYKRFKAGEREGIFLNDAGQYDLFLTLDTEDYFFLSEGTVGESGLEAYIVMDRNMKPLSKPFPYYYRRNDFFKIVFSMFNATAPRYISPTRVAKNINDSFTKFYEKNNADL